MRLCISGKLASSGSLPEQLAHMCRERLVCEVKKEPHYINRARFFDVRADSAHNFTGKDKRRARSRR